MKSGSIMHSPVMAMFQVMFGRDGAGQGRPRAESRKPSIVDSGRISRAEFSREVKAHRQGPRKGLSKSEQPSRFNLFG